MTLALVPVKELARAKERLAPFLRPIERKALALAMLQDVLGTLLTVKGLAGIVLVSNDPQVQGLAKEWKLRCIPEPQPLSGESEAVEQGARVLKEEGIESLLVVPADVPLITPEDVEVVLALAPPAPSVTLVPSKDQGTNALVMNPPGVIRCHFGPQSLEKHHHEARSRGIACRAVERPSLALDIDTPQDLLEFLARHGGAPNPQRGDAGGDEVRPLKTYRYLVQAGIAARALSR